ncbi:MAG: TonB family protein [Steroidobacteraceae bacterium]
MASRASSAPRPIDAAGADSQSAAAAAASPARLACEVIAVTTSDEFLLELGDALGGQASVRPVESLTNALEHLGSSRRAQLIAFDLRGVTDARGEIDRARARAPHMTLLAFADGGAEPTEVVDLEGSKVFALLPIPVDRRKTTAALESALAAAEKHAGTRAAPAPQAPATAATAVASAPSTNEPIAVSGRRLSPKLLIAGAIGLLLALGGIAWFVSRAPTASSSVTQEGEELQATAPAEVPLVQGSLDELLEKARLAMRQRRFTEPEGDNALVYFRSAIAMDASNAEARDGLARISGVLTARIEEAIVANRVEEATAALSAAKSAIPGDTRLAPLEGRLVEAYIARALADGDFDRAAALARSAQKSGAATADQVARWRADIGRRQDEMRVKRAIELANERLRDGRLVEPANDSAKHYVQQLRALAPAGAATQRLGKDLANAFLRKARESSLAGRSNDAERWLGEARDAGVTPAEISVFQRDVAVSRQRAAAAEGDRLAQLARERLKDGKLIEPANDSAAHYLTALQAAEESHSAIAPISRQLAARLIDRAGDAVRDGQGSQVAADLAAARRWGADAKDVQAVQQLATNARAQASAQRGAALQKALKRNRYVAPEYPPRALDKGESGSVTVEFVVDVSGQPRDVRVTASEPEAVFDKAALSAVRRWRYEPVIVDGVPVEIPTRAVIRFEAPAE